MAPHSSTLTWKIPWMEEPGRLQSMGFARQEYWSGLPLPSLRTNPREYQIVRTHRREPTWLQDPASPSNTLFRMPHLNNKQNKSTNPIISRQDYHLTQHCPQRKNKQTKKLRPNLTLYEAYIHNWTNLRKAETKRKKEFNLEAWVKEISNAIS